MIRALVILLIGSIILSCLLTPPVYSLLIYLMGDAVWPFARVYDRVIMVAVVFFLFWLRREFSLSDLKSYFWFKGSINSVDNAVSEKGFSLPGVNHFLGGFLLSCFASLVILPFIHQGGKLIWTPQDSGFYALKLLEYIPAAILISIIEECFFRILLFNKLRERLPVIAAALICSCCYAAVHFIKPDKSFVYQGYSLWAGFEYLGRVLIGLCTWQIAAPFFGFFLIGLVLCYAIYKTNSLYLCLGLHSGWVLAEKMVKHSFSFAPDVEFSSGLGGRYFLVSQPLVWISVLGLSLILWFIIQHFRGWSDYQTKKGS